VVWFGGVYSLRVGVTLFCDLPVMTVTAQTNRTILGLQYFIEILDGEFKSRRFLNVSFDLPQDQRKYIADQVAVKTEEAINQGESFDKVDIHGIMNEVISKRSIT